MSLPPGMGTLIVNIHGSRAPDLVAPMPGSGPRPVKSNYAILRP